MTASCLWLKHETELLGKGFKCLAGIDEAGRGPLAGPVVAGCVHIPPHIFIDGVNDSKKLTEKKRERLFDTLTTHPDIVYGIGIVHADVIDQINILQAAIKAMELAYKDMSVKIDYLLVDGVQLHVDIPSRKIIKGDTISHLIASASILAKVTRDRMMKEYHQRWPEYNLISHKGYGTKEHREALAEHGPCEIHRKTFEPIRSMLSQKLVL
ncbi:MAG: Ribonuclease HII [Chlamydiae bacterium]|nr:Ribonuclease HII [Chlamydiota bacterium]